MQLRNYIVILSTIPFTTNAVILLMMIVKRKTFLGKNCSTQIKTNNFNKKR